MSHDTPPLAAALDDRGIGCPQEQSFASHLWHRTFLESVRRMQGIGGSQEVFAMFKLPAYDPVGIAIMGFGVLLVVALALVF